MDCIYFICSSHNVEQAHRELADWLQGEGAEKSIIAMSSTETQYGPHFIITVVYSQ